MAADLECQPTAVEEESLAVFVLPVGASCNSSSLRSLLH